MTNLNLLDPQLQQKLRQERQLMLWRDGMALSFAVIACIGMLFVMSRAVLLNDFHDTVQRMNIVSSRNQPVARAIKDLNQTLVQVDAIQTEYYEWSMWLVQFTELIPPGNMITEITFDQTTSRFTVKGTSKLRENLLQFKDNLESSGLVKDTQFPLSNLLSRTDIDFEFSASVVQVSPSQ